MILYLFIYLFSYRFFDSLDCFAAGNHSVFHCNCFFVFVFLKLQIKIIEVYFTRNIISVFLLQNVMFNSVSYVPFL